MPGISLLFVSPHVIVCDLLQQRLAAEQGLACAGVLHSLDGLDDAVSRSNPDVVILDAALCNAHTADLIASSRERHPGLIYILLYDAENVQVALHCLLAGVRVCISKQCSFDAFVKTVYAAKRGEVLLSGEMLTALVDRIRGLKTSDDLSDRPLLSPRECAMLRLLAEGATNREIADHLSVSQQTVKNTLTKIFRRLGVNNRAQAVAWWRDYLQGPASGPPLPP